MFWTETNDKKESLTTFEVLGIQREIKNFQPSIAKFKYNLRIFNIFKPIKITENKVIL